MIRCRPGGCKNRKDCYGCGFRAGKGSLRVRPMKRLREREKLLWIRPVKDAWNKKRTVLILMRMQPVNRR